MLNKLTYGWVAAALLLTAAPARADTVTDWNVIAIKATETAGAPVPVQMRAMALVHAAIFDAVNAIERRYSTYAVEVPPGPAASADAAAAAAAHGILERLYPMQKPIHDAALAAALAKLPESAERAQGVKIGQEVADRYFAMRKDDGATAQVAYQFAAGAGMYQATPPMNANPVLPHWRGVRPFVITGAKQFAWQGPPAPGSEAFARDFNEVKRIGGRASTLRTSEQTAVAIHWAGSEVPPFNAVARAAAAAKGLALSDSARLFALMNMAMADSLIAGFEAKYASNSWRPVTAIRNAGLAANAAVAADPSWEPLLVTPPHPEYPSAHCLGAGAAVAVLQHVFEGDRLATSYVYPPLGVVLKWQTFSQIAKEVEDARVWGGIHYRTAVEHGTQVGRQVGEYAVRNALRPRVS
jgi:hypothetical protein